MLLSDRSPSLPSPEASPSPFVAASPSQLSLSIPFKENHRHYHLSLVPGIGIAVTVVALMMLAVLVFLIRGKSRALEDSYTIDKTSAKAFSQPIKNLQEGRCAGFCFLCFFPFSLSLPPPPPLSF